MMNTVTDIGTLVVETPGVCGGRPQIAGTGVSVRRIVGWYKMGQTPEEIADQYDHLSLAQVFAALTYYHANRSGIEADLAQEQAEYERLASTHGSRGGNTS
jgi:uncharacterized protein (DUF433 family)